jgi:probable biosynthetic protein (TIGR04098 family)
MPHTISRALGEVALLTHCADLHWKALGRLTGCAASRLVDTAGNEVYASVYFAEVDSTTDQGLAAFRPDDELDVVGTLGRYGTTMLEGRHRLYPIGTLPAELPDSLPPVLSTRLSFVLVALGKGPDDLRVSTPANADIGLIPSLEREPDSYRLVRAARSAHSLGAPPPGSARLWDGTHSRIYPINPDRDLNGVGLLYFVNYVAFLDAAERAALEEAGYSPEDLDGRVTVRRRIAYYGNARSSDRLQIDVEAFGIDGPASPHLHIRHQVRRVSDGRLIALASAERQLRPSASRRRAEAGHDEANALDPPLA